MSKYLVRHLDVTFTCMLMVFMIFYKLVIKCEERMEKVLLDRNKCDNLFIFM